MAKYQPDILNDKMIKKYIIIGLISVLIVFGVIVSIKCAKLERENIQLKSTYTNIVDSIKVENQILEKDVADLLVKTTVYEHRIDSLKNLKQKIIVKYKTKYVVSENITESVKTLKENLKCETY